MLFYLRTAERNVRVQQVSCVRKVAYLVVRVQHKVHNNHASVLLYSYHTLVYKSHCIGHVMWTDFQKCKCNWGPQHFENDALSYMHWHFLEPFYDHYLDSSTTTKCPLIPWTLETISSYDNLVLFHNRLDNVSLLNQSFQTDQCCHKYAWAQ